MKQLSPRQIVSELDKYIIGQGDAKRAIAIAMRNRQRRLALEPEMQTEVKPKNLLMIGPTGVGKTEIARRLATIVQAPFIKVEATKYTEVGYVGRDVESMVRDLVDESIRMVKQVRKSEVVDQAKSQAADRLVKLVHPGEKAKKKPKVTMDKADDINGGAFGIPNFAEFMKAFGSNEEEPVEDNPSQEIKDRRSQLKADILAGKFPKEEIKLKVKEAKPQYTALNPAMEQMMDMQESLNAFRSEKRVDRTLTMEEAFKILTDEEADNIIATEDINQAGLELAQSSGIIFIDEMDKIASRNQNAGEVSRQGVQRDILPIVEGSQVQTKYGKISTDHILFIGSGAFHFAKPSDLIPELQGRFPIRVNLQNLSKDDFVRILTEPENALLKQYQALLATEEVQVQFSAEAIETMASYAVQLNENTDNIGARRLHTILETVLEELLFEAANTPMTIEITKKYVEDKLVDIVEDRDLSHYIL